MSLTAVDTSVAVPLLVGSHTAHPQVAAWAHGRRLALAGHAVAETYSVLTRLPGDARVAPSDAVRLIDENFAELLTPLPATSARIHEALADAGLGGGAAYDGLVALAVRDNGRTLATRDARARATYEALGIPFEVVAS
ncbi:MAG: PIN domain-containing protein [Tessaracoccus sp.]|uniref:PIN domain-containing protein n=1 Tax=Tessaracoccus sp. TaxID=1971211 RepID=UPI001EC1DABF|nr:PIN domain-containing protein [Tessaracoccus sp.]MBK7819714.1 PIN domain-containing protein [Tessaracoccus sp.]